MNGTTVDSPPPPPAAAVAKTVSTITREESIRLSELIKESEHCEDNTESIRLLKHSVLIRQDIVRLQAYRLEERDADVFVENAKTRCFFLYKQYPDIFQKLLKNEIDLEIMDKVLDVLRMIENGQVDQHEGSVLVGKILKELYIDSAMRRAMNLQENAERVDETSSEEMRQGIDISYAQFKRYGPKEETGEVIEVVAPSVSESTTEEEEWVAI